MLTYHELKDLINSTGFDSQMKAFYLSFLENTYRAGYSEAEKQRKYRILVNAIDAKNEAVYYNRWDIIIKDTIAATATDVKDLAVGSLPWIAIAIIAAVIILIMLKL